MSNSTLHPASANFLVDISDECESPGTMCASVNASGSDGISRLHVCFDWMLLPLGSVILSGNSVGLLLTTGVLVTENVLLPLNLILRIVLHPVPLLGVSSVPYLVAVVGYVQLHCYLL